MAVTGWKEPGTKINVDRDNKAEWSTPDNASPSDNQYAQCAVAKNTYSDWLRATNFGFTNSDIPSGATINGIELIIERHGTNTNISDSSLRIRKTAGPVGDDYASADTWPTADGEKIYGGAADLWGITWLDSDIKNPDFGFDLSAANSARYQAKNAYVDNIKVRIYYTSGAVYYHGLKIKIATEIIELALCDVGSNSLRIRKDGITYGIELVEVSDSNASPIRVKTLAGIKAIRKYT